MAHYRVVIEFVSDALTPVVMNEVKAGMIESLNETMQLNARVSESRIVRLTER